MTDARDEPITGKSLEHLRKNLRCDECKGEPDYIYFHSDDGKVLSSICKPCRDAFEATLKSMSRMFCSDQDCDQHD